MPSPIQFPAFSASIPLCASTDVNSLLFALVPNYTIDSVTQLLGSDRGCRESDA
jgi:hypothetical protein